MLLMSQAAATTIERARLAGRSLRAPSIGPWLLGFALVGYLAFAGGGYDPIVRDQVSVAVCWIVLVGAGVGVLRGIGGRAAWIGLALLAALAAWTALGVTSSASAERSQAEVARLVGYGGILALALAVRHRSQPRQLLAGVASAIGLVATMAVLSRLYPAWFPASAQAQLLPSSARRLSYPVNYWNGLAALVAIGAPLLLYLAGSARTLLARALAGASLPVIALCLYFTVSRSGTLALGLGLATFMLLASKRALRLISLAVAAAGSWILLAAAGHRPQLRDAIAGPVATHQGSQMLVLMILVCMGVALLHVALGLLTRHVELPRWLLPDRRRAQIVGASTLLVLALAFVGIGGPGWLNDRWNEFKRPPGAGAAPNPTNLIARVDSSAGNGRYQLWEAAAAANATHPWRGIGAGTFELWWAQHATVPGFVRDAHSLYMQTLAEVGIVGLALLSVFLALAVFVGARRALELHRVARGEQAAAVAGIVAFAAAASLEWLWQLPVAPAALLILCAVVLAAPPSRIRRPDAAEPGPTGRGMLLGRGVLVAGSAVALVVLALSLAASSELRGSQRAAQTGHLSTALAAARTAQSLQPTAATPRLQVALVYESAGKLALAAAAARDAVHAEPGNWRMWLTLARIDAKRGAYGAAVHAFRHARALNPLSGSFAELRQ